MPPVPHRAPRHRGQRDGGPQRRGGRRDRAGGAGRGARAEQQERQEGQRLPGVPGRNEKRIDSLISDYITGHLGFCDDRYFSLTILIQTLNLAL